MLSRYRDKINRSELSAVGKEAAIAIAAQLMSIRGHKDIPIGPALSHVLGNVAMEPVDATMASRYEGRYFRYVDDIVVVAPRDSFKQVKDDLSHALAAEGLELNESKTDFVAEEDWARKSSVLRHRNGGAAFNVLVNRLGIYLARHPKEFERVRTQFRDAGYSLPFRRLRSGATYSRFQRFIAVFWQRASLREQLGLLFEPPRRKEEKVIEMRPPAEPMAQPERDPREELLERARAAQARVQGRKLSEDEGREHISEPTLQVPTIEDAARNVRVTFPEESLPAEAVPAVRKTDIFTERVTLSVNTEMRDAVEALAREMQRRRTKKDERITANTVMRVAINSLLDQFRLEAGDVANTEEELLELAKRSLKR